MEMKEYLNKRQIISDKYQELSQIANVKNFMENKIVKMIRKDMEAWVGLYEPQIEQLLLKLNNELAIGLSKQFNSRIKLDDVRSNRDGAGEISLSITAQDLSYTDIVAGSIAALGGIGLTLLVGGTLMPLVSFAAMPLIRKSMLESRLSKAKEAVMPELKNAMIGSMMELQTKMHENIALKCEDIKKNAIYTYENLLQKLQEDIKEKMYEKNKQQAETEGKLVNLKSAIALLKNDYLS